ncbi:hypothetical protein TUSST3_08850 [Streptomyces sp. TUS-ST3]|uniref:hypothetical protein n=1 Tax=Streptomyces sp. TUS-ST3 TaxID=3025591 RepID=UPI0024E0F3B1|nr:hypothetical protein [Streptomyces sp. TUS-ST3]GLP64265.1 hypothetical protein TUSST3_08850 [Streptomyces sp. TUS-ST3]
MISNPTPDTARIIRAPWTPEQVDALNAFQRRGGMHPFTCGGEHTPASPALVAYTDGWRCPQPYGESCDYRQDWAHAFMTEQPAAASVSAVDQTTRDRIAEAAPEELAKHVARSIFALKTPSPDGSKYYQAGWDDGLEAAMDAARDALLAVLPPPADRAAVLHEAADAITAVIERDRAYSPRRSNDRAALGGAREIVLGLIDKPRRLADEAQQPAVGARQPDTETAGCTDPIECSHEAALGEAESRLRLVLGVAEVIEANGVAWAADSVRRAVNGDLSQPAAAVPAAGAGQDGAQTCICTEDACPPQCPCHADEETRR